MRYFETSLSPIDKPKKSKYLVTTPIGVKAVKSNKYLSKYSSMEKQANPLAWFLSAGARIAGAGGAKWLARTVASPKFHTAAKYLGSQGTLDSLSRSGLKSIQQLSAGKLKGSTGKIIDFRKTLTSAAGKERFTPINSTLPKSVRAAFGEQLHPRFTFSKVMQSQNKGKELVKWLGNTLVGYKGNVGGHLRRSFHDSAFISKGTGKIYKGSRIGNITRGTANKGVDVAILGEGAFGAVQQGESRTGKLLGGAGLLGGFRSSSKMIPGLLRGTLLGEAGSRVGSFAGRKKTTFEPISNQYRYFTR